MANLTDMTARQLADYYFELTGKTLKPSSYSKAKFIELIEAVETLEEVTKNPLPSFEKNLDAALVASKVKKIKAIEEGDTFTLTEAAASIGISPKVARARYRMVDNDGIRTRYEFPRSDWDRVISLISPKRNAR